MVALAAGLLVASAAYALAKSSLDAFQQEARMQSTQYGSTLGLLRLANDLKRAGYMATPDITTDMQRCGPAPTGAPAQMLRAIRIVQGTAGAYVNDFNGAAGYAHTTRLTQLTNGRRPDRVTIAGNFVSGEIFQVASVNSNKVVIQSDSPAVARVRLEQEEGGPSICQLFRPQNRSQFARIVDAAGFERYVIVTDCQATPNPPLGSTPSPGTYATYDAIELTFANLPGWANAPCVPVVQVSGTVNPVNVVDYAIADLTTAGARTAWGLDASFGAMLGAVSAGATGDDTRTDLVRRMWDGTGAVIPGSGELISEYAVDLAFGAWRMSDGGLNPTLEFRPYKDGDIATTPPQRLRGVRVRLSTRARAPDRVDGPDTNIGNPALPLRRFNVFADGSNTLQRYARVRNAFMDINLPNLRNARW